MTDYRVRLEQAGRSFPMPDLPLEDVLRRRDRKRLNERIVAGVVVLAIVAAVVSAATKLRTVPAPSNQPTVTRLTGNGGFLVGLGNGPVSILDPATGQIGTPSFGSFGPDGYGLIADVDWFPDGSRVAYIQNCITCSAGTNRMGILVYDVASDETRMILQGFEPKTVRWSPDGSRIAYILKPDMANNATGKIVIANADGTSATAVQTQGLSADSLSWSPDGSQIAFAGSTTEQPWDNGANDDIYVVGTVDPRPKLIVADATLPAWSPDGLTIAFRRGCAVGTVEVGGGEESTIAHLESRPDPRGCDLFSLFDQPRGEPGWSPDGRYIAVVSPKGGLAIMRPDGSNLSLLRSRNEGMWPAWQPIQ